jgi:hypothetical protein
MDISGSSSDFASMYAVRALLNPNTTHAARPESRLVDAQARDDVARTRARLSMLHEDLNGPAYQIDILA